MGVNKVEYFGETLIDITDSTVTPESMASGTIAYNAAGERIVGTGDFVTKTEFNNAINSKADADNGVYYIEGTGSTAGTWLGSHDDIDAYYNGLTVAYKIPVAGSSGGTTLNINGLGAVTVVRNVSTDISTAYAVNSVVLLVYTTDSGTAYWKVADYNTTYSNVSLGQGYGTCSTAEATKAKVVSLSSYALTKGGIVAVKFTNAVPASATMNINSKGAKNIYHRGAAIAAGIINAGDTATFIYDGTRYHLLSVDVAVHKEIYLSDQATGTKYKIYVLNGQLMIDTAT